MTLFKELKRRNVLRVGAAYVVVAWLVIQVVETIFPAFGFGDAAVRVVTIVFAIGLIPTVILAWAFELTPEGLKKDKDVDRSRSIAPQTGKKLDRIIMVVLSLALGYFAFDKFVLDPQRVADVQVQMAEEVATARQEGRTEALVESYGEQSIAVLAFDDMSADGDQEYLSDGIAEELLNLLAKIPELRVISRSSAFSFKGKAVSIPDIAEQLNVAHILEGSVRKAGNRVRITAQLIEARSDTHLWSETYDRELVDIFAIQDEIAAAMVEQLKLKLLRPVPKLPETDPETYTLYLRALRAHSLQNAKGHTEALELLQKAVVLDPDYANAWALLGHVYAGGSIVRLKPLTEVAPLARQATLTALKLDPANGRAHYVKVLLSIHVDRDLAVAASSIEVALNSGRIDPQTVVVASILAKALGRVDQAISVLEFAIARDPLIARYHDELSLNYYYAGRLEEARISAQTAIRLDPGIIRTRGMLAFLYFLAGETDAAFLEIGKERWVEMRLYGTAIFYKETGDQRKSEEAANALKRHAPAGSIWLLYLHAMMGENEAALQWLELNSDKISIGALAEVNNDPLMEEIRQDPRYQAVLHQLGISKAQTAGIELNLDLLQ